MILSNYIRNKLIDFLFRGVSYTPPANLYIALCKATPTETSTGSTISEISGGNYQRIAVPSTYNNWLTTQGNIAATSNGTTGRTGNAHPITWNNITWSDTVVAVAFCDASTGGDLILFSELEEDREFELGANINFDVNALRIVLA